MLSVEVSDAHPLQLCSQIYLHSAKAASRSAKLLRNSSAAAASGVSVLRGGVLFAVYIVRTAQRWLNSLRDDPPEPLFTDTFERRDVPA